MLRIGICDDDLLEAQKIEEYISHMPFHDLETEVFLSGEELLRHHLEDKKYNIILLDIELPSVNGIETAIKLRKIDLDMVLIFITAHREYVYKTFEALPFRFLEKPVSYDMLLDSMGEAIRYLEERRSYFFYKKGNRHYQIPARDILYFEALNRKIKIVSLDQTEICYGKIHTLTGQLNPDYFLRVHNSFIINMDHITSFSEKELSDTQNQGSFAFICGRYFRGYIMGQPFCRNVPFLQRAFFPVLSQILSERLAENDSSFFY